MTPLQRFVRCCLVISMELETNWRSTLSINRLLVMIDQSADKLLKSEMLVINKHTSSPDAEMGREGNYVNEWSLQSNETM